MLREGRTGFESETATGSAAPRVLVCAGCRRVITDTAKRIAKDGSHSHVFVNPDNETFEIGCFSEATGLLRLGPSSMEATWFAGFSWQSEVCGGCRGYLGWLYRRGDERFHGLILAGLIEL